MSALALAPLVEGQAPPYRPRPGQPPPQATRPSSPPPAGAPNPAAAPGTPGSSDDPATRRTTPEFGPWESGPVTGISNAGDRPATVRSVNVVTDQNGPAVEILTSRPVIPAIRALDGPPRLVIDLPNSNIGTVEKRTSIQRDQVTTLRVDQFREEPPTTRVVVDLVEARAFTWDAAGNRLMVRLKPPAPPEPPKPAPAPPAPTPTVTSFSSAPRPAVVPVSSGSGGSVVMAGTRIANGSSITTGTDPTVLSITRGGEILVCPRTSLAVTASRSGRELMVSMNTGAMEANYHLDASADSVFTPDFRILFAGPGEFHYAVSSDAHGNTCVRTLEGNTTSAIVSELMGDRIYQVKPNEEVLFRNGHIDQAQVDVPMDCGCPRPREPVILASVARPQPISDASLPSNAHLSNSNQAPSTAQLASRPNAQSPVQFSSGGRETSPLPPSKPGETHIQVEAPFVFRANDPANAPVRQASNQPGSALPPKGQPAGTAPPPGSARPPAADPPPQTASPAPSEHRGFFGKVKGFFGSIFR